MFETLLIILLAKLVKDSGKEEIVINLEEAMEEMNPDSFNMETDDDITFTLSYKEEE